MNVLKTKQTRSCLTLLFITLFASCTNPPEAPRKPNIVFILADDLGWSDLACYGNTFHQTPHLDQLAKEGIRFTNAYAACPVCSPTRASILTGKYPATLHLTDWIPGRQFYTGPQPSDKLLPPEFLQHLPTEAMNLAKALKQEGYVSASIGKWHLGGEGYLPTSMGFDVNIAGRHYGSPPSYYYPYYVNEDFNLNELREGGHEGEYLTDRLSREATAFIRQHQDSTFFLYLPFYAVHIPLQPKDSLFEIYTQKVDSTHESNFLQNPYYAPLVQSVDEGVGRIIKTLEALNLRENTIVVFMSDNGGLSVPEGPHTPATNNFPLKRGKGHLYEGGIREPLIISYPEKLGQGKTIDEPVTSVDFFPTLLHLAGIDHAYEVDGKDFTPLLQGENDFQRGAMYWHYPHYSNQGGKPGGAIREGDFKLIEFYEDGHVELYNIKEDPTESEDLASSMPEKTASLHQKLRDWRAKVGAKMPTANPDYQPSE